MGKLSKNITKTYWGGGLGAASLESVHNAHWS